MQTQDNQERALKWQAKRQLASLKKRLEAYKHPLEDWQLDSCKKRLQQNQKKNLTDPWRFVLPKGIVGQSNADNSTSISSSDESSPGSGQKSAAGDSEKAFQSELRETDNLKWLNTLDDQSLSMDDQLKGKILVVDFWTSCCINCVHVLAELEELEAKFKDFPEIAFIGVHSAKFDREEALQILRQAVIRYDVKHPCINDCKFDVWNSFKLNNWPTLMIVGPDGNIIQKMTEERNTEVIEHLLYSSLQMQVESLEKCAADQTVPELLLSGSHLPIKLEKTKAAEYRQKRKEQGLSEEQLSEFGSPETITALRQNLSQPGKVIFVDSKVSQTLDGRTLDKALPYQEGIDSLLVIADSSNNRILILDASTHKFIEQVGTGRSGYREGSFTDAEFNLPQGLCHFVNPQGEHCLMICDVKNHLVREINLHAKTVRHVAGLKGVRGSDTVGGDISCVEQELASPWDITLSPERGEFIITMAGTHQLWALNLQQDRCSRYSGSGAEGNENSDSLNATWAQPSGISFGSWNGQKCFFIADSESSAIRAMSLSSELAMNVAGANDDALDLFDFGDEEGPGYQAKLQHPLGVHFCEANNTLYVTDTYNHKIKVMAPKQGCEEIGLVSETPLLNWIGDAHDARVRDGQLLSALLNEPNGCFAKTERDKSSGQVKFAGLYIADTGNDCIRFCSPDGFLKTLELEGVPDVRLTSSDCIGGQCTGGFDFE